MPVIIPIEHYQNWLNKDANADQAFALLNNQAYEQMAATPVSDWFQQILGTMMSVALKPVDHGVVWINVALSLLDPVEPRTCPIG